jgi:hypothetical protein
MCRLDAGGGDNDSKYKGNRTIIGQITTFIEELHLTYRQVFEEIPYRQLLMMSADKLRRDTSNDEGGEGEGEKEYISGKELMQRMRRNGKS